MTSSARATSRRTPKAMASAQSFTEWPHFQAGNVIPQTPAAYASSDTNRLYHPGRAIIVAVAPNPLIESPTPARPKLDSLRNQLTNQSRKNEPDIRTATRLRLLIILWSVLQYFRQTDEMLRDYKQNSRDDAHHRSVAPHALRQKLHIHFQNAEQHERTTKRIHRSEIPWNANIDLHFHPPTKQHPSHKNPMNYSMTCRNTLSGF